MALKTAEAQGIERFVVPIRIDSTPFEETFVELIDIQAIDCRDDWLNGLNSLVSLLQRDEIPRDTQLAADKFSLLLTKAVSPAFTTVREPENLISTWLPMLNHPHGVRFYNCAGLMPPDIAACAKMLEIPAFGYFALLATTADINQTSAALNAIGLGHVCLSERAYISWSDFVAARWADLPRVRVAEARRFVTLLINQALTHYFSSKGTLVGQLANGRPFWFFEEGKFVKNEVRFMDYRGKSIRRQLVGYSQKRRVFWHFAVQARYAVMGGLPHIVLSPHVTFSADGRTILPSKAQLHSLRRSFCRSWWNKRWRDLLQGFVAALAGLEPEISIPIGTDAPLMIGTAFKIFESTRIASLF